MTDRKKTKRVFSLEWRKKLSEAHKGQKVSEETKQKLREHMKGEKNHFFGKHHTEESKKKISTALKGLLAGEKHPMFGKQHSEETRRMIGLTSLGRKHTEEFKEKMAVNWKGSKNPNWKNGICTNYAGYLRQLKPEHHFADSDGYVMRHRIVYEEYHKCSLLPWADIHHINAIKDDNRIENLEAMTKGSHTKLHVKARHEIKQSKN